MGSAVLFDHFMKLSLELQGHVVLSMLKKEAREHLSAVVI